MSDSNRSKRPYIYWGIVVLIALIAFVYWFIDLRTTVYTDDCYVEGNKVVVTPLIDGYITNIYTDDTFLVHQGDLIAELDSSDQKIALKAAQEDLAQAVRTVCSTFHTVQAYDDEIEMRVSELIKTKQDWDHRVAVVRQGGVSIEDYEHAQAALRESFFGLKMTQNLYQKEVSLIQETSIRDNPMVLAAAQRVREAFLNLSRTKIHAPVTGLVAERTAQVGMWNVSGTPLMSVIPLDQIWVNANYKETQMEKMRLGQRVTITSDLYGRSVVYHGTIVGLPGGAGNAFSILPPQNLSGNWIKIVQRLPVRVQLDVHELERYPLRIGLSLFSTVHLDSDSDGLLVPTSSKGAPQYKTDIFVDEEAGSKQLIASIIMQNLDPTLKKYHSAPFIPHKELTISEEIIRAVEGFNE